MRKLLVVFTAILVVAFAAPAFATDATWSGEFDFGGITAFAEDDIVAGWANAYADVTLDVDEYNDVILEFVWSPGTAPWAVGWAELKTDVGMALGLPVGLTASGGYIGIWSNKYEVTGHATERVDVRSNIFGEQFIVAADLGMATVKVGVGFETGPAAQDYAVYVDAPGIADLVDVEAGYFIADNDDFQGRFMASAKAVGIADMVDVAAGFAYSTVDGAAPAWFWGAGVKGNVSMFGIGVGVSGEEDAAVNILTVDVNVGITDEFGVDVGVGLGLSDALDTFGGLEPSVYFTPGASTWRLGYLYQASDVNGYMYCAPAAAPVDGSGLFLTCGLDF